MPLLSIVVPAFNEEVRLPACFSQVRDFLDSFPAPAEVIVVDDGSIDSTAVLAEEASRQDGRFRLIRLGRNRGKGAAVRQGVLAATGEEVLFCDVDLSTPLFEIGRLRDALACGADLAIGSRTLPGSVVEARPPWGRRFASPVQRALVRLFLGLRLGDTQCGFKLFRREAAQALFGRARIDGFAFDLEILHLARLLGFRVVPVPVHWSHDPDSRVRLVRDSLTVLLDMVRIRRLHAGIPHRD